MARILSIDYGTKRCGLAVTDPLQLIVSPLETVSTKELLQFLVDYMNQEEVEKVVIGRPTHADGNPTFLWDHIQKLSVKLTKQYPDLEIDYEDETLTSVSAKRILLESGAKMKKRRDKKLVDKISAVLILQSYLKHI
jgi:putative Holliday junction resolvase